MSWTNTRIYFCLLAIYIAQGAGIALMAIGILPCAIFVLGSIAFEHAEDERKTFLPLLKTNKESGKNE